MSCSCSSGLGRPRQRRTSPLTSTAPREQRLCLFKGRVEGRNVVRCCGGKRPLARELRFKRGESLIELGSDLAESPLAAERFPRGFRARANDLRVLLERSEPAHHLVAILLEPV